MIRIKAKLGEVCLVKRGTTITKKQTIKGDIPVIGGGTKPTYFHNKSNRDSNCITISGSGASAGFVNRWDRPIFASDCSTVEPKDETQLHKFIYYFLLSRQKFIYENFRSGAAQPHVYAKDIETLDFPIIPIDEQKLIVKKLDYVFAEIDKLIKDTNYKCIHASKVFNNYLSKFFKEENSTWGKESLKNISLKIGSGATPKGGKDSYKKEGISLIRSMNVRDLFFKEKDLAKIDNEQAQKLANVEVKNNDILLNITGASVARCCIVKDKFLPARVNQHVSIIRLKEKTVIPKFLMYGLVSKIYKDQLLKVGESSGATRQAITKKQIEEFQFSYPKDLELQKTIMDNLDKISSLTLKIEEIYNKQIQNYEALKLGVLTRELMSDTI